MGGVDLMLGPWSYTPDAGAGTMRVIPPPGNPGGDPNLRPK